MFGRRRRNEESGPGLIVSGPMLPLLGADERPIEQPEVRPEDIGELISFLEGKLEHTKQRERFDGFIKGRQRFLAGERWNYQETFMLENADGNTPFEENRIAFLREMEDIGFVMLSAFEPMKNVRTRFSKADKVVRVFLPSFVEKDVFFDVEDQVRGEFPFDSFQQDLAVATYYRDLGYSALPGSDERLSTEPEINTANQATMDALLGVILDGPEFSDVVRPWVKLASAMQPELARHKLQR